MGERLNCILYWLDNCILYICICYIARELGEGGERRARLGEGGDRRAILGEGGKR